MSTTLIIAGLLADMPPGKIFTTGELLGIGSRASIDQCLHRLVHNKAILRLARGVFSNGPDRPVITPRELAEIKARAFHKEIREHPSTTAQRLAYVPKPEPRTKRTHTFATNGNGSTSFDSIFGRIHLKGTSARKSLEFENEVWELVKSLWHLGPKGINAKILTYITRSWGRKSQSSLQRFYSIIPQWLRELFPTDVPGAVRAVTLNLIPHASDKLDQRYHESAECREIVRNMPPAFSTFEEPIQPLSAAHYAAWDAENNPQQAENICWCPDTDECVCPVFTCIGCQSTPMRNRFSMAYG